MLTQFFNHSIVAANDERQCRERTVPIPSTITAVPGYPDKLAVFKIAASKFWQVRCWIAGRTHRRSTKTTSLRKAQSYARQFYEQLLVQRYGSKARHDADAVQTVDIGASTATKVEARLTFGALTEQLYANEQARVNRGEFSYGSLQVLRNRLDAHILPRWASTPVMAIDYKKLLSFVQLLSKRLNSITVSQYLVAVRKVLSHAVRVGALDALPEFPKIKVTTTPRGAFTPSEYWRVIRAARKLRGQAHPLSKNALRSSYKLRHTDQQMPPDLAWAIGFMVNSFIRPSDLKTLKHRHVEVVRGKNIYLRLTLPETKRHGAPIVTLRPAVRIYEQICRYQRQYKRARPDDYLFLPHVQDRNYAQTVLGVMFNWVLDATGLKSGANGQPRSLYSLRHSAITFKLLYGSGIDLLTLARNARTSIEVINKHYASTVTGEQNIAMLQSRRT